MHMTRLYMYNTPFPSERPQDRRRPVKVLEKFAIEPRGADQNSSTRGLDQNSRSTDFVELNQPLSRWDRAYMVNISITREYSNERS